MDIKVINRLLPITPHKLSGADCCGCIFVQEVTEGKLEFVCSECGEVVGSLHRELLIEMLQPEGARPVVRVAAVKTFLKGSARRCYTPAAIAARPSSRSRNAGACSSRSLATANRLHKRLPGVAWLIGPLKTLKTPEENLSESFDLGMPIGGLPALPHFRWVKYMRFTALNSH